jgi:hypothetical protein
MGDVEPLAEHIRRKGEHSKGDLGHKIICQIAFQKLNDKARNEVVRLIAHDGTFDSFTDACTWPDHPRKRAENTS